MPIPTPRIVGVESPEEEEARRRAAAGDDPFAVPASQPMLPPEVPRLPRVDLTERTAPVPDRERFRGNRTMAALGLLGAAIAGSDRPDIALSGAGMVRGAAANQQLADEAFQSDLAGFRDFQERGQSFNLGQLQREQQMAFEQASSLFDEALGQAGRERIQSMIEERQASQARLEQELRENDPLHGERVLSEQALQRQRQTSAAANTALARQRDRAPRGGSAATIRSTITGRAARPPRAVEREMSSATIDLEVAEEAMAKNLDLTKEADLTRKVRQARLKVQQLQEELLESNDLFGTRPAGGGAQANGASAATGGQAGPRAVTPQMVGQREALSEAIDQGDATRIQQLATEALRQGAIDQSEFDLLMQEFGQSNGEN